MSEDDDWDGSAAEIIGHFEINATILAMTQSEEGIDYAISALAAWVASARERLSADELALLMRIGGVLFRIGEAESTK